MLHMCRVSENNLTYRLLSIPKVSLLISAISFHFHFYGSHWWPHSRCSHPLLFIMWCIYSVSPDWYIKVDRLLQDMYSLPWGNCILWENIEISLYTQQENMTDKAKQNTEKFSHIYSDSQGICLFWRQIQVCGHVQYSKSCTVFPDFTGHGITVVFTLGRVGKHYGSGKYFYLNYCCSFECLIS